MERSRLPTERRGVVHKFDIAGTEGYLICGEHEDGSLGEIFIVIAKEGSTLSGVMDAFATATVDRPAPRRATGEPGREVLVHKGEPAEMTANPDIRSAHSIIIDYIFHWLGQRYLGGHGPAAGGAAELR